MNFGIRNLNNLSSNLFDLLLFQTEAECAALNFLAEVIKMLNEDPGKFEKCQKELNTFYIEFSQNNYVISNSIEILFEHVSRKIKK